MPAASPGPAGPAGPIGAGEPTASVLLRSYADLIGPGRTVTGCLLGSADLERDIPRLAAVAVTGAPDLAGLVTRTTGLDAMDTALVEVGAHGPGPTVVEI